MADSRSRSCAYPDAGQYHGQSPPAWQRRKKGDEDALGRSRGGLSTKVHAVVDGLGNPLRLMLSPGNRNDICYAQKLLEPFDLQGKFVIADKGYDSDKFVRWPEERGAVVVIPSRKIAKHPRNIDQHIYMERLLLVVKDFFIMFTSCSYLRTKNKAGNLLSDSQP